VEAFVKILLIRRDLARAAVEHERPSLMKITRLHIASTSCKIAFESKIVFVCPMRRIVSRTSRI